MAVPIRRPTPRRAPELSADNQVRHSWVRSHTPNLTLGLLRVVAGAMFMEHGVQKLFGWLPMQGMPPFTGTPGLFTQMGIAGWLELWGGALIVMGLLTRVTAFLLSGEMAVAYFQAHAPQGFWPVQNHGELAALYSFVFLALAGLGAGAYSLDHLIAVARGRPKFSSE